MMSDTPSVACGREKARDFDFSGRAEMRRGRWFARGTAGGWRTGAINSFNRRLAGLRKMGSFELCLLLQRSHLADHRWGFSFGMYWRREGDGLARGLSWVRDHEEASAGQAGEIVGVGDWEQKSQVSGRKAAPRGIRQWEGGSWTSLMRVSARSTPTGRHSGGLAAAAGRWWRSGIHVFNHN
jgi:hypothetical protein